MNVDEILANPNKALGLPEGAIPMHVVIIAEYANPGAEQAPGRMRLSCVSDEDCPPWVSIGMLRFAQQLEYDEVKKDDDDTL